MRAQLTLFGDAEPIPDPLVPEPLELLPTAEPDSRQHSLFEGSLTELHALSAAFEQLDLSAARVAWARAEDRFPEWARLQGWGRWIEDLAWLRSAEQTWARGEGVEELLALLKHSAEGRFSGMKAELREQVVSEQISRTARQLVEAHGPKARLQDGRPVGCLALLAGRPVEAANLLGDAAAAEPGDGQVLGYLGEALWCEGRTAEALAAYRDAYLLAPNAVDEAISTCGPIHDLLDHVSDLALPGAPGNWVPILADLEGLVFLDGTKVQLPEEGPARALASYRRQRQAGVLSEVERIALKRAILSQAPQLKELVRRL